MIYLISATPNPDGSCKTCRSGDWYPAQETVCSGEIFQQVSYLSGIDCIVSGTRFASGTKTGISYPVEVYRAGGYAGRPGYQATFAGCVPVLIGTLEEPEDTITVSWPSPMPEWTPTVSSVEARAIDSCGNIVYSNNKLLEGEEAAAGASLVISGASLTMNAPLQCGGIWCPCPSSGSP